jgi:hypothetical protein
MERHYQPFVEYYKKLREVIRNDSELKKKYYKMIIRLSVRISLSYFILVSPQFSKGRPIIFQIILAVFGPKPALNKAVT